MIEKPTIIPINDQVGEKLNQFLEGFNLYMEKELDEIEKDVENIKNVLKHHGTMA